MNIKPNYNKRRYDNNRYYKGNSNKSRMKKSESLFQVSMIENPWELLEKQCNITSISISDINNDMEMLNNLYSSVNASVSFVEVEEIGMNNHENKNKKKNDNNEDKYKEEDGNSEEDEEIVYNPSRFRR